MTATVECEIKLHFNSPDEARAAVLAIGATLLRGRRLQEDRLLDSGDGLLRHRTCLLRIRMEAGQDHLTYKGPLQSSTMKVQEELETSVGDGVMLLHLLEELSFHVWFCYQKYREEFAHRDVIAAIDETPVGTFVEIEGNERGITEMSQALGRSPVEYVLDFYRSLFLKYREAYGLAGPDMVFDKDS